MTSLDVFYTLNLDLFNFPILLLNFKDFIHKFTKLSSKVSE
jgi:hypothetical protein